MNNKISLLYVDDEHINRKLFEINFGKKYNIINAVSGFEGLNHLKNIADISIVISDMKMPGMNGIDFIKKAKKEFPNIIFFILTGYGLTEDISDAIEARIVDKYFSKPFNMNEMVAAIDKVIR